MEKHSNRTLAWPRLQSLFPNLKRSLEGDPFWDKYLTNASLEELSLVNVHLAIFVEPYLRYILDGRKTIESRFSVKRSAPYQLVNDGDIILLKKAGGPIVGICKVAHRWFYKLDPISWVEIKNYAEALCAQDPFFWEQREAASFATLMQIENVRAIPPIRIMKRDRRGWVVLQKNSNEMSFIRDAK